MAIIRYLQRRIVRHAGCLFTYDKRAHTSLSLLSTGLKGYGTPDLKA